MNARPSDRSSAPDAAPPSQGVKYIGSKLKMVPHILAMAQQVPARTVLDGFAGTTRVAQALAASKYHVMCNDLAYFDPPYGSNNEKRPPSRVRYAAYYHLWTSICRFDRPILFGKAQRRTVPTRRLHPFSKSSAGMRKTISLR